MTAHKLRFRMGEMEFESEGRPETVERHMELFARLMKGDWPPEPEVVEAEPPVPEPDPAPAPPLPPSPMASFHKIISLQGPMTFLKVAAHIGDAVMLILLAQKIFKKNESVSGRHIMEGLRLSGLKIPRVDYQMMKFFDAGVVNFSGDGRARRYTLTPMGIERAEKLVAAHLPRG